MRKRSGISLVELLIAMSACTIVLTMSAMLIHRVMHVQSRSRQYMQVERNAFRLEQDLRNDARQAVQASTTTDPPDVAVLLRFTGSEQQVIEYQQQAGSVQRLVKQGERVLAREDYVFPATTTFVAQRDGEQLLVINAQEQAERTPADKAMAAESPLYHTPLRLRIEVAVPKTADVQKQAGDSS